MLLHQLLFLTVLCYVHGSCPKFDEWRTATTSINGPLVCAKLYNNENCTGFPILFGVNISVSDLSHTLTVMPLKTSHVSALVRPGCTMHLWKSVNYTGTHSSSTSYSWKVTNPDFMSALCNCSTEASTQSISCKPREAWTFLRRCDYRDSEVGGPCTYSSQITYSLTDTSSHVTNLTEMERFVLLKTMRAERADLPDHIEFDDARNVTKVMATTSVNAGHELAVMQRSYVCGNFRLATPDVRFRTRAKIPATSTTAVSAQTSDGKPVWGQWVYSPASGKQYMFGNSAKTWSNAEKVCVGCGGRLAIINSTAIHHWIEAHIPLTTSTYNDRWWTALKQLSDYSYSSYYSRNCNYGWETPTQSVCVKWVTLSPSCYDCGTLKYNKENGAYVWDSKSCDNYLPYICEK